MSREKEIVQRIQELRQELEQVEGTPTEVYTRIVGYYRSLKNWNRGKREEYGDRLAFRPDRSSEPQPREVAAAPTTESVETEPVPAHVTEPRLPLTMRGDESPTGGAIASYVYFYRPSCPSCPPVRTFMDEQAMDGVDIDVDTPEGMLEAVDYQVLSTPTVIFLDADGNQVGQAGSVSQLRTVLQSAS